MFKLRSQQTLSNNDVIHASGLFDDDVSKRKAEDETKIQSKEASSSIHIDKEATIPNGMTVLQEEDLEETIYVFPDYVRSNENSEEEKIAQDWDLTFSIGFYDEQEEVLQRRVYHEEIPLIRYNEKHIYRFCQRYDLMTIADCLLHMFRDSKNITGSLRYIARLVQRTDIDAEEIYFLAEIRLAIAVETERLLPWELLYVLLQHVPGFPSLEEFLHCIIPAIHRQQKYRYVQKSQLLRDFLSNINYCPA